MRPDQTEGIDDARRTGMSKNKETIYPLPQFDMKYSPATRDEEINFERSVNERLAPIFRALLVDPDGWESEYQRCAAGRECDPCWVKVTNSTPPRHKACDNFRLVPKRKMMTVTIPVPDRVATDCPKSICAVEYHDERQAREADEAIRKAMEGK